MDRQAIGDTKQRCEAIRSGLQALRDESSGTLEKRIAQVNNEVAELHDVHAFRQEARNRLEKQSHANGEAK